MSYKFGELQLRPETDTTPEHFIGDIICKVYQGRVVIGPNPNYQGDRNSPKYLVREKVGQHWFETGFAWEKESSKVDGGRFLSISLDSPEMQVPLYLSAFPKEETDAQIFDVIWSRPKQRTQA